MKELTRFERDVQVVGRFTREHERSYGSQFAVVHVIPDCLPLTIRIILLLLLKYNKNKTK